MLKFQNADCNSAIADNSNEPQAVFTEKSEKAGAVSYLWVRAPKFIVYSNQYSDGAKMLYLILLDYQGKNTYAFPSLETLAKDTNKSVRRVQQLLKELEAGGAIEIVSQPGWVNLYRVCPPINVKPVKVQDNSVEEANKAENNNTTELTLGGEENHQLGDVKGEMQKTAPTQFISPLPMQQISSELDSSQLDSKTVCKKSRTEFKHRKIQAITNNPTQTNNTLATGDNQIVSALPKTNSYSYVKSSRLALEFATLTAEQQETVDLLCKAGLANTNAIEIALTNPQKADLMRWIDFAATKANPGGYLAVVLGKGAVPPSLPKQPSKPNATMKLGSNYNQQLNSVNSRSYSKGKINNQQAGVVAYMQRHASELEQWQQNQAVNQLLQDNSSNPNSFVPNDNCPTTRTPVTSSENNLKTESDNAVVDPDLRRLIKQLDRQASSYLKAVYIDGEEIALSFIGSYLPVCDVQGWLPFIQSSYPAIKKIRVE